MMTNNNVGGMMTMTDGGEQWRRFLFNNQQGRGMTMMDNVDKTTTMNNDDSDDGPRR